ncbi:hypothetical protein ACHAW5_008668 [Stephanodiscus triporus]|uniref:tyrosine--tRNA ligase n=1 Tax=Stephanodiscus triporus TaxID=2934178 RepID=A0ABD3PDH5_9STRA
MRDRGFLHQCTDLVALDDLLADAEMSSSSSSPSPSPSSSSRGDGSGAISAYLGFDATADSLHVGSLLQIMILRHLQKSGHRPIVLVGGGTSKSVRQRLSREAPFTFLEFNYMILQAYDFLELNRRHGAVLQLGGSDQWGNMISGVELGRRVDSVRLYALTAPLITTSDGKKMGKTAGGAVWLNPDRLSEYDYWQFWRNTDDGDVIRFLKLFTELPLEEIRAMEGWTGADVNRAKVVLADEATALLHGRECLRSIRDTVNGMFGGGAASTEGLNRVYVNEDDVGGDGVRIADLFVRLGLASSKKEAKRLISGGGAKLGETKIADENAALGMDAFADGSREVTLRAGKKRAGVVELK